MIWKALKLCKNCTEKCAETYVRNELKRSENYVRNEMKMHWNYVRNALKVRWKLKGSAPSRNFSAFQRIQRMSYKNMRWNGAEILTRVCRMSPMENYSVHKWVVSSKKVCIAKRSDLEVHEKLNKRGIESKSVWSEPKFSFN